VNDFLVLQTALLTGDPAKWEAALLAAGLVLADAKAVIARNTGVIAESLSLDRAERFRRDLSSSQFAAAVVPRAEFELGPVRHTVRAFLSENGIVIVDPIEGPVLHPFDEIEAVGLGLFGKEDQGMSPFRLGGDSKGNMIVVPPQLVSIHESRMLLHFVHRKRGAFELERGKSVCAATEKPAFMDSASNFHEFASMLRQKAPRAAFGRDYDAYCANPKVAPLFQSHHDFLRHVSWLAWTRREAQKV
jgi:hypothetical protein